MPRFLLVECDQWNEAETLSRSASLDILVRTHPCTTLPDRTIRDFKTLVSVDRRVLWNLEKETTGFFNCELFCLVSKLGANLSILWMTFFSIWKRGKKVMALRWRALALSTRGSGFTPGQPFSRSGPHPNSSGYRSKEGHAGLVRAYKKSHSFSRHLKRRGSDFLIKEGWGKKI